MAEAETPWDRVEWSGGGPVTSISQSDITGVAHTIQHQELLTVDTFEEGGLPWVEVMAISSPQRYRCHGQTSFGGKEILELPQGQRTGILMLLNLNEI